MKKSIMLSICILLLVAGTAFAGTPSAKFAATWGCDRVNVVSVAETGYVGEDTFVVDFNKGYTLATIKVPQDKELMIGLSAEIGLVTDTSIRGKEGGSAKALAGGAGHMLIFAVPVDGHGSFKVARPGDVVLSSRFQELEATLGGVLDECTTTCETTCDDEDCETICDTACTFTDEEIGLMTKTLAAHHFNFLLPNMDQGVYKIVAVFTTSAVAGVDIVEGSVEAAAYAKAFVGKYMLTVQQVRAAKDTLSSTDIIE